MKGVNVSGLLTLSIPLFAILTRYYSSKHKQKQLSEEEQEENEVKASSSWAELDRNLLGEIVSRLCVADQARFGAVNTHWLAAARSMTTKSSSSSSLPWHGCKYPGSSEFRLYNPLSSPSHLASQHLIDWSQLGIPSSTDVYLHLVKHNWVFLSVTKPRLFFWTRTYAFLFSPFTKRIITLPTFDYPNGFHFVSTFSTRPDSPDCVFCCVDADRDDKIAVLTYRNGDKQWTARQFNMHPDFKPWNSLPHILDGILYILSPYGQVASYNILNGEFIFDRLLHDEFVVHNSAKRIVHSFVLNGELLIIGFNPDVRKDATLPGQQFVRRYHRSLKVWLPVRTLGDYALFFNPKFIDVSLVNTKDIRTCNGLLSNKVYHFFSGGCLVYSLQDGELVQFKCINSTFLGDGENDLPEYKYNYSTPATHLAYWLEAPPVHSSSDN
ncbi:uncharacterized protein LOC108221206 [Daucus carota subsp. sativus]|uniref:uncharacterized protein LOC108221206 n=1 Tax=Daucus carota subsp. sativus TaxID=79200 RepID=UPI0007EF8603|nr:PREDICTED: uncharacterized protein LOC108221206 [Daucus carota subsp. sativus]